MSKKYFSAVTAIILCICFVFDYVPICVSAEGSTFSVKYYSDDDAEASPIITDVVYGVSTKTKTVSELGFSTENRRFLGWKVFRDYDNKWKVKDADGKESWASEVPEGGSYRLFSNGVSLTSTSPAGSTVSFYAQWGSNNYTVKYYLNEDAEASEITSTMQYGVYSKLKTVEELGFSVENKKFSGWKVFRDYDNKWLVQNAEGTVLWSENIPEGGKYSLLSNGASVAYTTQAESTAHLYAQWGSDSFNVKYFDGDDAEPSDTVTSVKYGVSTKIKTLEELGFSTEDRRFLGWKAFRDCDNKWYVQDADGNKMWASEVPEGGSYKLYSDGASVSETTAPGSTVYLYAQWGSGSFFVKYYENENSEALDITTSVQYGTSTKIKTIEELGFSTEERNFLGWKAFRDYDNKWYVQDADGNKMWASEVPEGGSYKLYSDGASLSETTPAGSTVSFYAQWGNNTFNVMYYSEEDAEPSEIITSIKYGVSTCIATIQELDFSTKDRKFVGWKVFRDYDDKWLFTDSEGNAVWAKEMPENGKYRLIGDGSMIAYTTPIDSTAHLYAQWVDNSFRVDYHLDEDTEASESVLVDCSKGAYLKGVKNLGFKKKDKVFYSWTARRDDGYVLVQTADGMKWKQQPGKTESLYYFQDKSFMPVICSAGRSLSLYAYWIDTTVDVTDPLFGADGQDSENDKYAIQLALNLANNGTLDDMLTVNVPSGNYYIDDLLRIYSNTKLLLADDACIIRSDESRVMLANGIYDETTGGYDALKNVTVQGGKWDGNITDIDENGYGRIAKNVFYFYHASNITIKDIVMEGCCGNHFIEFAGVKDSSIENVKFSKFYRYNKCDYSPIDGKQEIIIDDSIDFEYIEDFDTESDNDTDASKDENDSETGSENDTDTSETSSDNDTDTSETGSENDTDTSETSSDNDTDTSETGSENDTDIYEIGSKNDTDTSETGSENDTDTSETGSENDTDTSETDSENDTDTSETDSENDTDNFETSSENVSDIEEDQIDISLVEASIISEAIQLDYASELSSPGAYPFDNTPCKNIRITGNVFNGCLSGVGNHHKDVIGSNITISDNTFINMGAYCVNLMGFEDSAVLNNSAENVHAFICARYSEASIKNNIVYYDTNLKSGTTHLIFSDNSVLDVENNEFYGAEISSIYGKSSSLDLENNIIEHPNMSAVSANTCEISFVGNTIDGTGDDGIQVKNCEINVDTNIIKYCEANGIEVTAGNSIIKSNEISHCGVNSILIMNSNEYPDEATGIIENNVINNKWITAPDTVELKDNTINNYVYFVFYHEDDEAEASSLTTTVKYGVLTPTAKIEELGYSVVGRKFLGWKAYRDYDNTWYVVNSAGKAYWSKTVPQGGSYKLYKNGAESARTTAAGSEAHFYAQWAEVNDFTVRYHEDNTETVNKTMKVTCGTPKTTDTIETLGYSKLRRRFVGWKVYRDYDNTWLITDSDGNKIWSKEVPEGGKYCLYENGFEILDFVPAATNVDLYAQWEKVTTYTVVYHENDEAEASELTTQIEYGVSTPTAKIEELGYSTVGRKFVGWKVFRDYDNAWYVIDANGKAYWSNSVPEGGSYKLYRNGAESAKTAPAGTSTHFYAQWSSVNYYTVRYHEDNTETVNKTVKITCGTPKSAETIETLGYSKLRRRFIGWKVYRDYDNTWLMTDSEGNEIWSKEVPEGSQYCLYENGFEILDFVPAETNVDLYAQWEKVTNYTVVYHEDDEAEASELTTQIEYGVSTPTAKIEELGYSTVGRKFVGWKVFRDYDNTWYVIDANGKAYWSNSVPEGGSYKLYRNGAESAKTAPAGTSTHFYAQWETIG